MVGAPRVRLTVTSTATSATLFLSLWQVTGGVPTFPRRLVAPVTVPTTPGQPTTVDIALPAATWTFESGSVVRLLVTATDSAYAGPRTARADRISLDGAGLTIPVVAGTTFAAESDADTEAIGVAIAIGVALLALAALAWWHRRQRRDTPPRPDLADTPLVVANLVKTYKDGHRAVDDVSWNAERGQVVGLLGPNGAGKTTTLRMVMGLIRAGLRHRPRPRRADQRRCAGPRSGRRAHRGAGLPAAPDRSTEPARLLGGDRAARGRRRTTTRPSTSPRWVARWTARCARTRTA